MAFIRMNSVMMKMIVMLIQMFTLISLEGGPTEKSRELALVGTGTRAQKSHMFIFNQ